MRTLRQRFLLATLLLLGLQIASTGLALVSWRQVLEVARDEQALAGWRADVSALGSDIREEYVHQAHTYVLGDGSHLAHGGATASGTRAGIDRLAQLPLSDEAKAIVHDIAVDHTLMQAWFDERVAPLARAGALDRATASELHDTTEVVTSRLTGRVEALLARLDAEQAVARSRAQAATTRAWWATVTLTVGALLLAIGTARALAQAVLAPVDAIRAAAAGLRPASGDELAEIAAAFDTLTARLRAEEDRRVRSERLAALGEMSAAVAHELMNPLAVILGHARMSGDPALAPIREEADHARRVVEGLLGFARPGQEPASAVALADAASAAVDRATPTAELRDLAIRLAVTAPGTVTAPPSAVRQVLDNLLRNAVEASPPGAAVEVTVTGTRVEILDRGPGLPATVRARLYEPFSTGRPDGTGLGLAVSQRIARALGGVIQHVERPGGGTVARWDLEGPAPGGA